MDDYWDSEFNKCRFRRVNYAKNLIKQIIVMKELLPTVTSNRELHFWSNKLI
jgi:hypothetical protein